LLVAFPTANSFRRNVRTGMSVQLLKEEYSENNFTFRVLTPVDNQIVQVVKELKKVSSQLDIRAINENTESNRVIIVLADRKESLIVEIKDNTKDNMYEAAGSSIYSNSKPIVLSYIAIFEILWKQSQPLVS
jgi:two-component system, OmpR family, sensor histidine kinase VicK